MTLYFQNSSFGLEGLNTHVLAWSMCLSLAEFLDTDFYFDYEIPCSTPPDYASHPDFKDRFGILLESERSLVSQLMTIPDGRRVFEIDREVANKVEYQVIWSHFATTQAMKEKFEGSFLWEAFAVGRFPVVREEMQAFDLVEWTHSKATNPAAFYFLPREEKSSLLDAVKLAYLPDIEKLAARMISDLGVYNAIHLRQGDYLVTCKDDGYSVDSNRFRKYIEANFADRSLPIAVATDGLQEKEMFARLFAGYDAIFIDERIFDDYLESYKGLMFTDFNVVTILNELICAAADTFIGTYRSTFTAVIHRLRQERYGKRDFNYFPDDRVLPLVNDEMKIMPDRTGFFDWNRFSVFAQEHSDIGFRREWDHERTMVDV